MQYRKRCEKASPSAIYRLFQSVFLQLPHDRRLVDLQLFSDFTRCTAGLLRVGQDLQLQRVDGFIESDLFVFGQTVNELRSHALLAGFIPWQIFRLQIFIIADDDHVLHDIFELSDIARPRIML